jgi:sialate O-acetylesterase
MKQQQSWSAVVLCALTAFLMVFVGQVKAEQSTIELGTPYTDNAILQRAMKVPVWGWSEPGTKITVTFAGQAKTATTDKGGKWMLELDPLTASAEPRDMVITEGGGETRTLKNILVGEVWLASGQSNMQWIASKCDVGQVLMEQIAERVAEGEEDEPIIREAKVTNYFAHLHPIERARGEWLAADGNTSAIAFAFAYKLYQELGVPIGILNCSFSQTAIQAWTPREGFAALAQTEYTRAIHKKVQETNPATPEHQAAWGAFYKEIEGTIKANAERVKNGEVAQAIPTKTPGNLSGNRDATWLFNARLNPMIPYAIRGGIWNQGYANMGEGLVYYHNLHSMIHGWRLLWKRPELPVYFHQFYCPGQKGGWNNSPSIGSTAEMRLGTWQARDITNAGMASQIDIMGAIHYGNKALPGQRLALHALKNQYGKAVIADGPMFKSYAVEGDKLIVTLEHAEGGLLVAETGTNSKDGLAIPTIVPSGDEQVNLFYLADENRVWHPARMKIDGATVIVTAPGVKSPRGVSYGTGGIGFQPNLYNRALLPTTPFIYYDHKLVTSDTWPDEKLDVAGVVIDPASVGKLDDWRKMPILSTQFRDNAVLQAGQPVTFWGSVLHDYGHEAEGEAVIHFSFADIKKTIPVKEGPHIAPLGPGQTRGGPGKEWRVTVPPMEASAEPRTLKVSFTIDGELAHERIATNIVVGDVWFVAAPQGRLQQPAEEAAPPLDMVRVIQRKAKRSTDPKPSRYSVAVSRTPKNRFASEWTPASKGFAAVLGQRIYIKTGKPVGIVFMQNVGENPALKSWIPQEALLHAPSLMADYQELATVVPGNPYYDANAKRYVAAWQEYWSDYIPEMIATKAVPDAVAWGGYPALDASVTSTASQTYNVLVHSFTPGSFKGVLFLSSEAMVTEDEGAHFGAELSVLANGWKKRMGGEDPYFFYTIPERAVAPKITRPKTIVGRSMAVDASTAINTVVDQAYR